jgi:hypothetical protein
MLWLSHVQGEIIDKVGQYRLTLSIIYPCTCDKHNIWPHCKTILSYLVDYLPLHMWQTQHLTTLQDDIVLPCRLSPLVHVTTTTSDHNARRYCPTLSIISPCTCDKHNIWPHCKTILSYLVDYLPLYMWQPHHLTQYRLALWSDVVLSHVQGEILDKVGQYRLALWSDVVVVTCTRGDNRQGRTTSSCSVVRCCVCHMYKGR